MLYLQRHPWRYVVAALSIVTLLSACSSSSDDSDEPAPDVKQLNIYVERDTVPVDVHQQYRAIATYSDNTTQIVSGQVNWDIIDDTDVATIKANGELYSHQIGTATVAAAFKGKETTRVVTVTAAQLEDIQLTPHTSLVPVGISQPFTLMGFYDDDTAHEITRSASTVWSIECEAEACNDIASINAAIAKGEKPGRTTISAQYHNQTANAQLLVSEAVLDRVIVSSAPASVPEGNTLAYTAEARYDNNTVFDVTDAPETQWFSKNTQIANFDKSTIPGILYGNETGTTLVGAKFVGLEHSIPVTITDPLVTDLQLTPADTSLPVGLQQIYVPTAFYSNETSEDVTLSPHTEWLSSDPDVVAFVEPGIAEARQTSTEPVTLTAKFYDKASAEYHSAEASINAVAPIVQSLILTTETANVPAGRQIQYTLMANYSDSIPRDVTELADWRSDDTDAVTVLKGTVTGLVEGETATITASFEGISKTDTVTVTSPIVEGLQFVVENTAIPIGEDEAFVLTALYSDGHESNVTDDAVWVSDDESTAEVVNGLVSGVAVGITEIQATFAGITKTIHITVTDAVPWNVSIDVDPANEPLSLPAGLDIQLALTAHYSDTSERSVTKTASWWTTDTACATVVNGLVYGKAACAEPVTIWGSYDGHTDSIIVTVNDAIIRAIAIDAGNTQIPVGSSEQYSVTATDSLGNDHPLNNDYVVWESSNDEYASVIKGKVKGETENTQAYISATYTDTQGIYNDNVEVSIVSATAIADTLVADGNTHKIEYSGDFVAYRLPVDATGYQYLYIKAKGADGGKATRCGVAGNGCSTGNGGVGATLEAVYALGEGIYQFNPGGHIRFIIGEKGVSRKKNGIDAVGDGGGGTGVFYRHEGFDLWLWALVAGAGGGGAAGFAGSRDHGTPGDSEEESGSSVGGNSGGTGGEGGDSSSSDGGGGGGLLTDGGGDQGGNAGFSGHGKLLSDPEGGSGSGAGGFGIGSGGKGKYVSWNHDGGGGGGGGYSGGAGGDDRHTAGGGGGSWPKADTLSYIDMMVLERTTGGTTRSAAHGYIEYRFTNDDTNLNL